VKESGKQRVVATVTSEGDLKFLESHQGGLLADVLEFRLDNLVSELGRASKTLDVLPSEYQILATARHPAEGGVGDLGSSRRIEMYETFLNQSHLIDIELRTLESNEPGLSEIVQKAVEGGVQLIASFHDFEKCPSREVLADKAEAAYELGADIAKIAVVIENFTEMNRLVELVEGQNAKGRAISAMGMGPLGKLSRLVLAKAGSCLNYGYLQKENAPGQWKADRLQGLIADL